MAKEGKSDGDTPGEEKKRVLPEGRRVVRKRHRKSGKSSRETVILQRREIMKEMLEPEESGPLDVRDQVERLRRVKREQKQAEAPPMEERWGDRKHRRKGSKWLIVATFGVVIPLLAFVLAITLARPSGDSSGTRSPGGLNLDEDEPIPMPFDSTDPVAWFNENSVEAFDEAREILDRINESEEAEDTLPLLRDAVRTRGKMRARGFEWKGDFRTHDLRDITWEYGSSGDTGYMVLSGKKTNFRPFRAYFVNTPEGLRLDWEATTAWSQVEVKDLVESSPELPVALRGWIVKKPHFDSSTQKLLSWYQVLSADRNDFVWAYTSADSEIDLALKNALNYGKIVLDLVTEMRCTVQLRAGSRTSRPNEFELIEFVSKDWVQP